MHYLISQQPKTIVGTARPIGEKEMAEIAVRAAGGGYSERQVMESMIIAQQMRDGAWTHKVAGVSHSIIIAGEES